MPVVCVKSLPFRDLIGTFCIVNYKSKKFNVSISVYLIETFCIVNVEEKTDEGKSNVYLIETFCIVNLK